MIRYEGRAFELGGIYQDDGTANPKKPTHFNGPPRPELDKAWDDLIGSESSSLSTVTATTATNFNSKTSTFKLTQKKSKTSASLARKCRNSPPPPPSSA